MERRFNRDPSRENKGSVRLQKKLAETRRPSQPEPVPDITDFMNDWFFGSANTDRKAYNLTGGGGGGGGGLTDDDDYEDSLRNSNSKLTQEWLEEAKRMVASSPSRCNSPSRLVGSPRFAATQTRDLIPGLDRRDPLSRSARRHRAVEGFSGEILSKSANHTRSNSESFEPTAEASPASAVQKWFSNILRSNAPSESKRDDDSSESDQDPTVQARPPRQPVQRKSRFQNEPSATQSAGKPIQSRRTFRTPVTVPENQLLSPPKNLIESAHRRSISSSTCSLPAKHVLSPPRNLVESAQRRSISSSTCSLDKVSSKPDANERSKEGEDGTRDLNGFLREQRAKMKGISNGEISTKAKIVLSGSSNSTSSMVAAICYAWLMENRIRENKEEGDGVGSVVVPVMNMRRGRMWKQRQAAWLFHHVGVDATALLFSDEVDLESLMMGRQLSILVIGEDVLKTNGEVGSQCTILTDNYCEDAYDLLQIPVLKKLLLAGILLDTQNLNASAKLSMTRDAEAVQLLLVGSAPNYRNALFDQLMQDQRDDSFLEALRHNYGKPPNESGDENRVLQNSDKNSSDAIYAKTNMVSIKSAKPKQLLATAPTAAPAPARAAPAPAPARAAPAPQPASREKNKSFLTKWFGFGSK